MPVIPSISGQPLTLTDTGSPNHVVVSTGAGETAAATVEREALLKALGVHPRAGARIRELEHAYDLAARERDEAIEGRNALHADNVQLGRLIDDLKVKNANLLRERDELAKPSGHFAPATESPLIKLLERQRDVIATLTTAIDILIEKKEI